MINNIELFFKSWKKKMAINLIIYFIVIIIYYHLFQVDLETKNLLNLSCLIELIYYSVNVFINIINIILYNDEFKKINNLFNKNVNSL